MWRSTLFVLVAALAAPALAEEMPLVFEDDFEGETTERWEMTDPRAWGIEEDGDEQVLALKRPSRYEPPVRSPRSVALVQDLDVGDFALEVRAKQTGREYNHRDLCVFFGYQDPANFYYVHLASVADPHANSIFLVDDAPRVSIAEERTDGTQWTNDWHTLRIERDTQSGEIRVYFDDMDTPVMRTTDKTFLSGTVGLGSFDDKGHFDKLKVWGTPPAVTDPPAADADKAAEGSGQK